MRLSPRSVITLRCVQLGEHLPRLLADAPVVYHDPEPVGPQDEVGSHLRRTLQRGTQLRAIQPLLRPLRWAWVWWGVGVPACADSG